MKKIFSVLCALAVAISVPLLAFAPKVANAEEVFNPVYKRVYNNDPYIYNDNIATNTSIYYADIDFATELENLDNFIYYFEVEQQSLTDTVFFAIDGVPFELFDVNGKYASNRVVQSNDITFKLFPLIDYGFYLSGVYNRRGIIYATPTVVTVNDVETLPFDYVPSSTVNMYDMVLYAINNNILSAIYYYPWAFYALNDKLYANAFFTQGLLSVSVPYLGFSFDDNDVTPQFCIGLDTFTTHVDGMILESTHSLSRTRNANQNGSSVFKIISSSSSYIPTLNYSPTYYDLYPLSLLETVYLSRYNSFNLTVLGDLTSIYNRGFEQGYTQGQQYGYASGVDVGYSQGMADAMQSMNIDVIKQQEYHRGWNAGYEFANTYADFTFTNLLTSIVDTQLLFMTSLLDFNFLGFNMLTFFKSILTLCIVVIVLKMVL